MCGCLGYPYCLSAEWHAILENVSLVLSSRFYRLLSLAKCCNCVPIRTHARSLVYGFASLSASVTSGTQLESGPMLRLEYSYCLFWDRVATCSWVMGSTDLMYELLSFTTAEKPSDGAQVMATGTKNSWLLSSQELILRISSGHIKAVDASRILPTTCFRFFSATIYPLTSISRISISNKPTSEMDSLLDLAAIIPSMEPEHPESLPVDQESSSWKPNCCIIA